MSKVEINKPARLAATSNLRPIITISGHGKVEIFNGKTGELEDAIESDNMVFGSFSNLVQALLLGDFIKNGGSDYTVVTFSDAYNYNSKQFFNLLYLNNDESEPDESEKAFDLKQITGYASRMGGYTGTDLLRGTLNILESYMDNDNNKIRMVFDFPTNVAVGSFTSVGLMSSAIVSSNHANICGIQLQRRTDLLVALRTTLYSMFGSYGFIPVELSNGNLLMLPKYNSSYKPCIAAAGAVDTLTQFSDNLKDAGGVKISTIRDAKVYSGKLYVLDSTEYIHVYNDPTTLDGVNADAVIDIDAGDPTSVIYAFDFIDADTIACLDSSTATDPITGETRYRHLKIIDKATGNIISRIRRMDGNWGYPNVDVAALTTSSSGNPKVIYQDGYIKLIGDNSSAIIEEIYDYTSGECVFVGQTIVGIASSNSGSYRCYGEDVNKNVFMLCYHSSQTSSSYNTYLSSSMLGFLQVRDDYVKQTRLLLPSVATKDATQTMKVTYDLLLEPNLKA